MGFFADSETLVRTLQILFQHMQEVSPETTGLLSAQKMIIRLKIREPEAQVTINGRRTPAQVIYTGNGLKPDLDVSLSADALHNILTAQMRLRDAIKSGEMKVGGAIWKAGAFEAILKKGQELYPRIIKEHND